ncbi:GNAT family N-acetyltransferase [Lysinibacillus sp. SGAir0095]|uniref:GNAT family N-acetyltransferase n=1 Tax=Lysinibacillus sp. SGAir0095 TaxID=2070463 RepID=UPI0010CCBB57|nr:GNAT family N-acetyltransferase [Lysinibacillus sp. SGAir0095]QCR33832.1 hypothetical protein C1N55_17570 [Lysinibacillus sp. SGAir0095]
MTNNLILEQINNIEELELQLTIFNSKRALSNIEKQLQVSKIGNCSLLCDANSANSIYYNRIKGFGKNDLDKLDEMLNLYYEQNINPSFDMTPNNIEEEVTLALTNHGFSVVGQLTFMEKIPQAYEVFNDEVTIVEVTEKNAEEFVKIVIQSNPGMSVNHSVIASKKEYFFRPDFRNFIAYMGDSVAGIGSLFIKDEKGYIGNGFTFEQYRYKGVQKELLKYRVNKANELGITKLFTDVEFGSISHNNMRKLGFETVYINSFWMKVK